MIFFRAIDTDNWQLPSFRIDRPKGHPKDLFVLFKSPARVLNSGAGPGEERESDVGPGWAIIYEKFMPQRYYPTDGGYFLHDYMHFEIETEEEREALAALPLNKAFRVTFPEKITATVEAIRNELLDTSPDPKRKILNSYGNILLQRLKNEAEREAYLLRRKEGGRELEEEEREILRRRSGWFKPLQTLRNEVYRKPEEGWNVDGASKRLCLSRSHFEHLYTETFGISFTRDVTEARLTAARTMLCDTQLTVAEIGERCGMATQQHFGRMFRKYVGVTPTEFRKKNILE